MEIVLDKLLIASSLVALLFFFLNTQMHERYSHPAFIFLAAYAIIYSRPLPYLLASAAYFLNLEFCMKYFALNNYNTLIFDAKLNAALYLISIVLLFADLFDFRFYRKVTES